jgi:hypothetical protein
MRIAYVAEWHVAASSGVLAKIMMQSSMWRGFGHEVQVFLLAPTQPTVLPEVLEAGIRVIGLDWVNLFPAKLRFYANKVFAGLRLFQEIQEFRPDLVYYRQGIWYPGVLKALTQAPLVMEVNTLDSGEMQTLGVGKRLVHMNTRAWLMRKVDGFVAVSSEIARSLESWGSPVLVCPNGFDVRSIAPRELPQNARPQLVFAGSPGQVWHGVDKVIEMARAMPGCDFHVVGPTSEPQSPQNVVFHGFLPRAQLFELYKRMDFGIGSLALHRNRMREASPLKVREYLTFGLPSIIGYEDTDLTDVDFVLNLGGFENNVIENRMRLEQFVQSWKDVEIDRNLVIERVDSRAKESLRLGFMGKFVDEV